MIRYQALLISSLACLSFAEPAPAVEANPNPFWQGLEVREGAPKILPMGEDISSPFVRAHMAEQSLYTSAYLNFYHARRDGGKPLLEKLPDSLDNLGRPLWFDGVSGRWELMHLVQELYVNQRVEDLDRVLNDWSNPSEKMADGRWKLAIFDNALAESIGLEGLWDEHHRRIESWKKIAPQSPVVALIEAIYWRNYAWDARGEDTANTVTSDRWAIFEERLKKAETVLLSSKSYAGNNPLWGRLYIQVANELDRPKQDIRSVFQDEIEKNGAFQSIYITMVRYLLPKWGGSWDLVDSFIGEAVKNSGNVEGTSMYARLYWQIAREHNVENERLFSQTKANWPQMKQSFEDMMRLYPHSAHNLNTFAAVSCIANDRKAFLDLRARIGKVVAPEAWPSGFSLDFCERKFATKNL